MKKTYTRRQLQEAIAYWESQLRRLDERGKQYDPYVDGPSLTNVQDLADECGRLVEMGFGKTRLYLNVGGRDVRLDDFHVEV